MAVNYNKYDSNSYKLSLALISFLMLVVGGTIGFMTLESMDYLDALYMTVITLSTVGFGEVKPLHPFGRAFVIILILLGMGMMAYMASVIGQIVIHGQLRKMLGRRKMEKGLKNISDHCIIAGYGRVGRQVADEFKKKKIKFVVIEIEENILNKLEDEGIIHIRGTAIEDDVLRMAGIETAKTLISTLPDEAQNVYLTLTARYMNPKLNIIARADFDDGEKKLMRAGANHVVSPHVIGGQRMALASLRPHVVDFMHTTSLGEGELIIEEVIIPETSPLTGKTLVESKLKQDYGVNIIGMKKKSSQLTISPGPNTIMETDDILVIIGTSDNLERLSKDL